MNQMSQQTDCVLFINHGEEQFQLISPILIYSKTGQDNWMITKQYSEVLTYSQAHGHLVIIICFFTLLISD